MFWDTIDEIILNHNIYFETTYYLGSFWVKKTMWDHLDSPDLVSKFDTYTLFGIILSHNIIWDNYLWDTRGIWTIWFDQKFVISCNSSHSYSTCLEVKHSEFLIGTSNQDINLMVAHWIEPTNFLSNKHRKYIHFVSHQKTSQAAWFFGRLFLNSIPSFQLVVGSQNYFKYLNQNLGSSWGTTIWDYLRH